MKVQRLLVTIFALPLILFIISCSNSGSISSNGTNPDSNYTDDTSDDYTGDGTIPGGDSTSDIFAPIVSITSPANGSTLSGTVNISVDSSDNVGVTKVELWIGNDTKGHTMIASLTGKPYATDWDSSTLANGSYVITAISYDANFNNGTETINVTIDNVGGGSSGDENDIHITLTGVTQGETVVGSIALSVTATTTSGDPIERVDFVAGNETKGYQMLASDETSPYEATWDTLLFDDDLYDIVAIVFTSTQVNNVVLQVHVANSGNDTTNPTVNVTAPANSAKIKGTVAITADAADNIGVTKVEFYINDTLADTDTTSPYSYSWNTTGVSDGTYSIKAKAYDANGNSATDNDTTVTVDNTAPTVSITSPTGGTVGGAITITADAADTGGTGIERVEFYVDGTLKGTDYTSSYAYDWSTTSVANGSHSITAKAYDHAGNMTESSPVSVTVYNDPNCPSVTLTSPVNNSWVKGSSVSITATASSNEHFTITANGNTSSDCTTSGTCSYSWNSTVGTTNGSSYPVEARATKAGCSDAVETISVRVDNAAPSVNVTAPSNGATLSSTVSVTASAADTHSGVYKVEFYFNSEITPRYTDYSSPYSYTWDTTAETNGAFAIKAIAYDIAGNTLTDNDTSVTVDNDTTDPTVNITSPTNGSTVSATVSIAATASDNKGVTKVEFYVNGILKGTDTSPPYSYSWDTTAEDNGTFTLKAIAYDAAGNTGEDNDTSVTVDNDKTPPTVNITSPTNGATASGTISITADATDNKGVSKVEFYINDILKGTDTSPPYSYSWPTGEYANGSYTLKAIAYDNTNNTATDNDTTVTVNNTFTCQDWTDTAGAHSLAGRATYTTGGSGYGYYTVGGNAFIGQYLDSATVKETAASFYEAGSCGGSGGSGAEFTSIAADDGYVKANSDGSSATVGTYSTLAIGRGSITPYYNRAILSFDTSSIPDGATITRAYVQVTYDSKSGDPWASSNRLLVDVKTGTFGNAATETGDWTAAADASAVAEIASFSSGTKNSTDFSAGGIAAINKTGKTQVKLRFENLQASTAYIFIKEGTNAKLIIEYSE